MGILDMPPTKGKTPDATPVLRPYTLIMNLIAIDLADDEEDAAYTTVSVAYATAKSPEEAIEMALKDVATDFHEAETDKRLTYAEVSAIFLGEQIDIIGDHGGIKSIEFPRDQTDDETDSIPENVGEDKQ